MFRDLLGNPRQKVGLHIHTTRSDGRLSPEEAIRRYREAGFDAIAFTDHWCYGEGGEQDGLTVIAGAEYNIGGGSTEKGVYHILSLFADREPSVSPQNSAQGIIDEIHRAGGMAVLAHPAWSLNTPEMILALRDVDATEIYNAVSATGQSFRADSSLIVDMIASQGRHYPLLATDDAHYYEGEDDCVAYIMVESDSNDPQSLRHAIEEKRFYATQGPEIHLLREGARFRVICSPASYIAFASNSSWCPRVRRGEGLTSAEYSPVATDRFLRAFVIDANGKTAWSNTLALE